VSGSSRGHFVDLYQGQLETSPSLKMGPGGDQGHSDLDKLQVQLQKLMKSGNQNPVQSDDQFKMQIALP